MSHKLTERDLLAGGCRPVRAFVLAEEANTSAYSEPTTAEENRADEAGAAASDDGLPTGRGRQKKYRDAQKEKGLEQLQLWTTVDPEKRETLKALAAAISNDRVHSVCTEVLKHQSSPEALKAMLIGGGSPDVVELGLRVSADEIRPVVEAIIDNPKISSLIEHFHDDEHFNVFAECLRRPGVLQFLSTVRNDAGLWQCLSAISANEEFRALCLAIAEDPHLLEAAQAVATKPKVAAIATTLTVCKTDVLENVATVIKHPEAVALWQRATAAYYVKRAVDIALERPRAASIGYAIVACPGIWGKCLRRLVTLALKFGLL